MSATILQPAHNLINLFFIIEIHADAFGRKYETFNLIPSINNIFQSFLISAHCKQGKHVLVANNRKISKLI